MDKIYPLVFIATILLCSCTPQLIQEFVTQEDITYLSAETPENPRIRPCRDIADHIPDTSYPQLNYIRNIRVNVHFMNSMDRSQNMPEERAIKYAKEVLHFANQALEKNIKMHLPLENETPILPILWRYQLTPGTGDPNDEGIYFHYDDEMYYYVKKGRFRNSYNRDVIKKYAVNSDSILNFFFMPHHPDSVKSPTYRADGGGVALGTSMKVCGKWNTIPNPSSIKGLINHEVGHILGLSHTWSGNDGCDDTPRHPNCWHPNVGGKCDSLWSNNMMDYNAWQAALSPCQIGKVLRNITSEKSRQRRLIKQDWCDYDPAHDIIISDTVHWNGAKDLMGNLTIQSGGSLKISCRVSMPAGSKISVQPGSQLILNDCVLQNACGKAWEGIEIQKSGKETGKILIIGEPVFEHMMNPVPAKTESNQVKS